MFHRFGHLLVVALLAAALPMAPAFADIVTFTVPLSGTFQVPPADTGGTGELTATFDTDTDILSWTVVYGDLTGPATAAHFHGPATPGVNAPVLVPLAGSLASPITGSATLTDDEADQLLQGQWYINIHTAAFPGGEIRGQLVRSSPPMPPL